MVEWSSITEQYPFVETGTNLAGVLGIIMLLVTGVIFYKAGEGWWKVLIPIYGTYILFKLTWRSGWYFLLLLIPFVNLIVICVTEYRLCRSFGKGTLFSVLAIFFTPITRMILAFGSADYDPIYR